MSKNNDGWINVGQILEGDDGSYIKLDQYNQELGLQIKGNYARLELREPSKDDPDFVVEKIYLVHEVGSIVQKKKGGESIKLSRDAALVKDGEVLDIEYVNINEPHEKSPKFVLNRLSAKVD